MYLKGLQMTKDSIQELSSALHEMSSVVTFTFVYPRHLPSCDKYASSEGISPCHCPPIAKFSNSVISPISVGMGDANEGLKTNSSAGNHNDRYDKNAYISVFVHRNLLRLVRFPILDGTFTSVKRGSCS
jgi:hypothetical protein